MEYIIGYKGKALGVLLPMELRFVINSDYKGELPESLKDSKNLNIFDVEIIFRFYRELLMTEEIDTVTMLMDVEDMLESGKINNKDYTICEE